MAYPPYVREKARQLRIEKQLTVGEIAERLGIAKIDDFLLGRRHRDPAQARPVVWVLNRLVKRATLAMQAKYREPSRGGLRTGHRRVLRLLARAPVFRDLRLHVYRGGLEAMPQPRCRSATPIRRFSGWPHGWMKSDSPEGRCSTRSNTTQIRPSNRSVNSGRENSDVKPSEVGFATEVQQRAAQGTKLALA